MQRDLGQAIGESLAALVRHQGNAMAARQQGAGKRFRREEMSPGAAAGEDDETAGHASRSPNRRRVSASIMPTPSASASSDEPP